MSAGPCAVDDPSRAYGVADVDDLGIGKAVCQSGHLCEDGSVCSHAEADEAVVERHLDDLALRCLDDEGMRTDFLQSSVGQLLYIVFLHACAGACLGGSIQAVADDGHHLDDGDFCALGCEELDNVKADSAAADDDDLLALEALGICAVFNVLDHVEDGVDIRILIVQAVVQAFDRRQKSYGTCAVDDQIGIQGLDKDLTKSAVGSVLVMILRLWRCSAR